MTMLFFSLEVAPDVGGGFFHTLGSGQPRMPPRERQHEGFWFFLWCVLFPLSGHMLPEHVLAAGAASHACRRGSGSTRG